MYKILQNVCCLVFFVMLVQKSFGQIAGVAPAPFAVVNPTITSTYTNKDKVFVEKAAAFQLTTTKGDLEGKKVKIKFLLNDGVDFNKVALLYTTPDGSEFFVPFTSKELIYPDGEEGFTLENASYDFMMRFTSVATYGYTVQLIDASAPATVLASVAENVSVKAYTAPTLALDGLPTDIVASKAYYFSVTTTANDEAGTMANLVLRTSKYNDLGLFYESTEPGIYHPVYFDAVTNKAVIGSESGFALENGKEYKFFIVFDKPGETYNIRYELQNTVGNLLGDPQSIVVTPRAYITPLVAGTLHNKADVKEDEFVEFDVDITANDMLDEKARLAIEFAPSQAGQITLQYLDQTGDVYVYKDMTLTDGVAFYGGSAGFEVMDGKLPFRVKFSEPGTYDYKLRLTSLTSSDQETLVSETVTVTAVVTGAKDQVQFADVAVYPSVTRDSFVINLGSMDKANAIVVDAQGRQVLDLGSINATKEVNVNSLAKGMYFVKLHNSKGVTTRKVFVQ